MSAALQAPFPYFGGKRRAARMVWAALGDPAGYVEPFAGSAAVLLARPTFRGRRVETLNDAGRRPWRPHGTPTRRTIRTVNLPAGPA